MNSPDYIDAVVTWVDGDEPSYIKKLNSAKSKQPIFSINSIPGGRNNTRFANSGEIFYCLMLLKKNCPWIRKIFLITDNQKPDFLTDKYKKENNIILVDHTDIFHGYKWALPTFNSQSIETVMHRINGLSEYFIYLNDDFFILKKTSKDNFFIKNHVVLRGKWQKIERFGLIRKIITAIFNHVAILAGIVRPMAVLAQYRAAQLAGFKDKALIAAHTPYPIRKSTLVNFFSKNKELLEKNITYNFRNMKQFVPMPLANHLEIKASQAIISGEKDYLLICLNRQSEKQIKSSISQAKTRPPRFLCVQGLETATPNIRSEINGILQTALKTS